MSATKITDEGLLLELGSTLDEILERVSSKLYDVADPPTAESVDDALVFLVKARAVVRVFEHGPQAALGKQRYELFNAEGESSWALGARDWQERLETHAGMLAEEGRAS